MFDAGTEELGKCLSSGTAQLCVTKRLFNASHQNLMHFHLQVVKFPATMFLELNCARALALLFLTQAGFPSTWDHGSSQQCSCLVPLCFLGSSTAKPNGFNKMFLHSLQSGKIFPAKRSNVQCWDEQELFHSCFFFVVPHAQHPPMLFQEEPTIAIDAIGP